MTTPADPIKTRDHGLAMRLAGRLSWPWRRLWSYVFLEPYRQAQAEARAYWVSPRGETVDREAMVVLVVAALGLVFINYVRPAAIVDALAWLGLAGAADAMNQAFAEPRGLPVLGAWAAVSIVGYVVVPLVAVRFVLQKPLHSYGLRIAGVWRDAWLYAAMFIALVPLVWWASGEAAFQDTYPFVRLGADEPLWPTFWLWTAMYALQFVALEFFFRGFLVHGLRRRFGYYSVFVMMVPYCMIHFGKPMPETVGAIVAGLVLGSLSLKTRSIWLGAALHVAVALTMDLSVLARQDRLW